ncbi:MAG: AraC family transcriptional regulator [Merismopedia sp. SIO2A8]|nr:AraC family transcriptional regulator [Merismopedia sp. SIO2A8]
MSTAILKPRLEIGCPKYRCDRPEDFQELLSSSPVTSSHKAGWQDISLEYHQQSGCDTGEYVSSLSHIAVNGQQELPDTQERWLDGHFQKETLRYGDIVIVPAGVSHRTAWQGDAEFVLVSFEPAWLQKCGLELVDYEHMQLIPHTPPLQDQMLQAILFALKRELEHNWSGSEVYVDQLKTTLGMHLLRNYTIRSPKVAEYEGGLSHHQLRQAIDYIHAHLGEAIKLEDLAKLLDISQYHFCRLFRQSMGIPPYKYVMEQRMQLAKKLLRQEKSLTISDIALECGFANQSHFTQRFRHVTGTTPNAYRKK